MKNKRDFLCKKDVNIFLTFKFCVITQFQAANLTLGKETNIYSYTDHPTLLVQLS